MQRIYFTGEDMERSGFNMNDARAFLCFEEEDGFLLSLFSLSAGLFSLFGFS